MSRAHLSSTHHKLKLIPIKTAYAHIPIQPEYVNMCSATADWNQAEIEGTAA